MTVSARIVRVRFKNYPTGVVGVDTPGAVGIADDGGEWRLSEEEITSALRNSAPQETRGDEPVAWIKISDGPNHIREFAEYCEIADDRNGYIEYCGTTTDGRPYVICLEGPLSAKYDRYFILPHVDAASQQSLQLEREATITECINVKVLLTNLGGRSDDWIRGFDAGTNAYIDALEKLRTLATTLCGTGASMINGLSPSDLANWTDDSNCNAGIASATSQQSPRLEREGTISECVKLSRL